MKKTRLISVLMPCAYVLMLLCFYQMDVREKTLLLILSIMYVKKTQNQQIYCEWAPADSWTEEETLLFSVLKTNHFNM